MAYTGTIELISGIKQKNNGNFPLVDISAVQSKPDGERLDTTLSEIANKLNRVDSSLLDKTANEIGSVKDVKYNGVSIVDENNHANIPYVYVDGVDARAEGGYINVPVTQIIRTKVGDFGTTTVETRVATPIQEQSVISQNGIFANREMSSQIDGFAPGAYLLAEGIASIENESYTIQMMPVSFATGNPDDAGNAIALLSKATDEETGAPLVQSMIYSSLPIEGMCETAGWQNGIDESGLILGNYFDGTTITNISNEFMVGGLLENLFSSGEFSGGQSTTIEKTAKEYIDENAVLCVEQSLTPEQKAQARANIGVTNTGGSGTTDYLDLFNKPTINDIELNENKTLTELKAVSFEAQELTEAEKEQARTNLGITSELAESDPTVPQWAKSELKPTYTAEEIGALPASTIIPIKEYDLTITTQAEFEAMLASPTWLDATSVLFKGDGGTLEFIVQDITTVPMNVLVLQGINKAIIRSTNGGVFTSGTTVFRIISDLTIIAASYEFMAINDLKNIERCKITGRVVSCFNINNCEIDGQIQSSDYINNTVVKCHYTSSSNNNAITSCNYLTNLRVELYPNRDSTNIFCYCDYITNVVALTKYTDYNLVTGFKNCSDITNSFAMGVSHTKENDYGYYLCYKIANCYASYCINGFIYSSQLSNCTASNCSVGYVSCSYGSSNITDSCYSFNTSGTMTKWCENSCDT